MSRISSYSTDTNLTFADKWIGTDGDDNLITKNFTAAGLADLYNNEGGLNMPNGLRYKFKADISGGRSVGTFSMLSSSTSPTMSAVYRIIVSTTDVEEMLVPNLLSSYEGDNIILSDVNDRNIFGIYECVGVSVYSEGFYQMDLSFSEGNGNLVNDHTYFFIQDIAGASTGKGGTGSGTTDYIPIWSSSSLLDNSIIHQKNGAFIGIGLSTADERLVVAGRIKMESAMSDGGTLLFSTKKPSSSYGENTWIGGGGELVSTLGGDSYIYMGSHNTAIGTNSLLNSRYGYRNTALGYNALSKIIDGHSNTVLGYKAGSLTATSDASTGTVSSIYIGAETRSSSVTADNEIVIGKGAIGLGSNVVTFGNSDISDIYMNQDGTADIHTKGVWFSDGSYQGTASGSGSGVTSINGFNGVVVLDSDDMYVDRFNISAGTIYTALGLKADLVGGIVPAAQLPAFVDEVIEVADFASLPVTGVASKIYITIDDNATYRWGGTVYVPISQSITLGDSSVNAYYGDKGKAAYDHSLMNSGNPHNVTASDVGLGTIQSEVDGKLSDITAGAGIAVDKTNPLNPIVSATGSGGTDATTLISAPIVSTVTLGGIGPGDSFDDPDSVRTILTALLSPYVKPTLSSIVVSSSPSGASVEVGTEVTITSATISWVNDGLGGVPTSAAVSGTGFSGTTVLTASPQVVAVGTPTVVSKSAYGSQTWTFSAKDKDGVSIASKTDSVTWMFRRFFGATSVLVTDDASAQTVIDSMQYSILDSNAAGLVTAGSYNNTGTNFTYIAYAAIYADISSVILNGALDVKDAFEKVGTTFLFTNAQGHEEAYKIYKSIDPGAFASGDKLNIS